MKVLRPYAALLIQVSLVLGLLALLALLVNNTLTNMRLRGIQSGWDFLFEPVGFDISESWIHYSAEEPFWLAFGVGLINTLRVAIPGILLATLLGLVVAMARIGSHPLARTLARGYIEMLRNVPLLILLLMGYIALIEFMPDPQLAWRIWGWSWSKAGLQWQEDGPGLSPEYLALWLGLSLYTSAFIAEVFRAGIEAVSKGQTWAALSLGLQPATVLHRVVLPQALRVSVPPLTSQYLNLTKNSSLAVAIGYPDLVSIANTSMNQTGRAVECIALIMLIYLSLSLLTSWLMNRYNRKVTRHAH